MELAISPAAGRALASSARPIANRSVGPINENVAEVVQVALMKSTSRALQRQVDLTTAVCQERLLSTHVRHVLGLVDLVSDRVAFDDALDIYVRVLRLIPEQARNIGSRALAELGKRGRPARSAPAPAPVQRDEREEEPAERASGQPRTDALFGRLRRRVKGRVEDELRHRINLAAARAEDDLLETHVENSLIFTRALESELTEPEAVELYLETMLLPEGTADVIYHRALREIADEVLPPLPKGPNQLTVEEANRDIELSAEQNA